MRLVTLASCFALALATQACKTAPKNEAAKPAVPLKNEVKKTNAAAKADAKESEASLISMVTCKVGAEERTLEIVQNDGVGCAVKYTKAGATNEIGSAQNDASVCQSIVAKVRGNLETAGYACK